MTRLRFAPFALLLLTAPAPAQEGPPAKPAEGVIKAWGQAGLRSGWHGRGLSRWQVWAFHASPAGLTDALPAFRPRRPEQPELPALPDPKVPFALDLSGTEVTDAGLKELAGLKSLRLLNLIDTPVTDGGLKEVGKVKG